MPTSAQNKGFTIFRRKIDNPVLKSKNTGFTLIELMVVIAIIAILSIIGFAIFSNAQKKSRDSVRKQHLDQIVKVLENYRAINGKYPEPQSGSNQARRDATNPCTYGHNCYTLSTYGDDWIRDIASDFPQGKIPKDPINNAYIFNGTTNDYSYAYGNVPANGLSYDLFARLENSSDSEACSTKQYKYAKGLFSAPNGIPLCPTGSNDIFKNIYYRGTAPP